MNDARRRLISALQDFAESIEAASGFDARFLPKLLRSVAASLHLDAQNLEGTLSGIFAHKIADGLDYASEARICARKDLLS